MHGNPAKPIIELVLRYHTSIQRTTMHQVLLNRDLFCTFDIDKPALIVDLDIGIWWWPGVLCSYARTINHPNQEISLHRYGDGKYPQERFFTVKYFMHSLLEMNSQYGNPNFILVPRDKLALALQPQRKLPEHYWHYYVPDLAAMNDN